MSFATFYECKNRRIQDILYNFLYKFKIYKINYFYILYLYFKFYLRFSMICEYTIY